MSILLAIGFGRGLGSAWVGSAVLAGQLAIGWQNDWIDRDRDRGRGDKPLATGLVDPSQVRWASIAAALTAAALSFGSGPQSAGVHLVAIVSALGYNLRLKATWLSVLPYTVSFGLLPAVASLGLPGRPWPPPWLLAASALLGAGAHFIQVLPDIARDRELGISGLPQLLGSRGSRLAAMLLIGSAGIAAGRGLAVGPGPTVVVGLLGAGLGAAPAWAPRSTGSKFAFRLTLAGAALAALGLLLFGLEHAQ